MYAIKTILCPTDFSERSQYSLQIACDFARAHNAKLVLLHVSPPPAVVYGEVIAPLAPAEQRAKLWRTLELVQVPDPTVVVERRMEEGDASDGILKAAGDVSADIIVLGTHGRTGLTRVLMGSVAEQVVRKAHCPVLTVKMPDSK